jgi:hypothetical protein
MKHILTLLLILTLAAGSIAGLFVTPVSARIFSVQPTNEDGGPPTDQFTTADPIFAVFKADIEGGEICVVDDKGKESHCKTLAGFSGSTTWTLIAPGLSPGNYWLRATDTDPGYSSLSFPFTVTPCDLSDPICSLQRRISDEVVAKWKENAERNFTKFGMTCSTLEVAGTFKKPKVGRGFLFAKKAADDINEQRNNWGWEGALLVVGAGYAVGFTVTAEAAAAQEFKPYLVLVKEITCGAEQMYYDIKQDPPDPNYTTVAQPFFTALPITGDVIGDHLALTLDRKRAFGRAQLKAYERYLGAVAAGDENAVRLQAQAIAEYGDALTIEMKESASALRAWGAAQMADSDIDNPAVTQTQLDNAATIFERVRTSGFTQDEINQLTAAGLSQDEIDRIRANYNQDLNEARIGVSLQTIVDETAATLEAGIPAFTTFSQEAAWVADGRAPKTISLLPVSASLSVSATHIVSASATDSRHVPVAGLSVALRVTGVNPSQLTATTNAKGVATFSYVGNNPGDDSLSATAGTATSNVATANWSVHVNSPPSLQLSNYQTYEGGGSFSAEFADPDSLDTHTGTIDWGDGSPAQPLFVQERGGSGLIFANHFYADDGQFTLTVTVTDNHGGVASGVAPMNVKNAAPQVFRVGFTTSNRLFKPGDTVTAATSFFDSGARDSHTAVWDWGDGATTPAVFTETGGTVTLYESHTYTAPGVYLVKLIVTDDDGATGVGEAIETIGFFPTVTQGSIEPVVTETGKISTSISGLGITEHDGVLKVEKPVGATVRRAFIGAATRGFFRYLLLVGDVKLEGTSVRWDIAAPSGIQSFNFWGEVTDIVKAKLDASPAGQIDLALREENSNLSEGEVLVVIFDDPNQLRDNTIALLFGAQQTSGDTFVVRFAKPLDLSDPYSALTMSLGISFGHQDQFGQQYSLIDVNGRRMTTSAGGEDDGEVANGALLTVGGLGDSRDNPADPYALPRDPRADDELYDLKPFVNTGDTSLTVVTSNPSGDDNIFFAAFYLRDAVAVIGEGVALSPASASIEVGSRHTLTATAQNAQGNLLQGRNVTFEILSGPHAGLTSTVATDAQGLAQFSYSGTHTGTDTIVARFVDSDGKTQTSNTVMTKWEARTIAPTLLAVSPVSGIYGGLVELSARLTADGKPLVGSEVSFNLNGVALGVATTNAVGVATITNVSLAGINAGAHSNFVVAHFPGDAGHVASDGTADLTVGKGLLTITADNKFRIYNMANPPLTFKPSGFVNSDTTATAFTGAPTLATTAQTGSSAGAYPITAATGTLRSTNYSFTFVPGTLTVNQAPTNTLTDGKMFANNGAGALTASLLDINSLPIVNRTLKLSVGTGTSAQTCSAPTNVSGKASCQINAAMVQLGPGTISGSFAGDNNYLASAGNAAILIFAFPAGMAGGNFVIGDRNAVIGKQVTFWGAQWANLNQLSGGAAPSSFKGFANQTGTNPVTCGGSWTTGSGNSSGPPSSIPAYMAVIASSSTMKSGSTIAGNVRQIVIVKTDSGYDSNSGHSGTGTVVAVWCQ